MSLPTRLTDIMKALRAPEGCPWDQEQDHLSLKPYLIEECYECLEAIDQGDDEHLKEELGDVLLQVVFHAQIAAERGSFNFEDIEQGIVEKMIRRHPHVFGDSQAKSVKDVKKQWEDIKAQEKKEEPSKPNSTLLDKLPSGLPPIQQATQVQKRAAKRGFEFSDLQGVFEKFREELDELEEAAQNKSLSEIESELGDLFFIFIKTSRFLNCDPESALRKNLQKFSHRFHNMEKALSQKGKQVENSSLEELSETWNQAKSQDLPL